MIQPGRRLYLAGSIALILVAALHTWGQFAPTPPEPALSAVLTMMRGVRLDLGLGMQPSVYDIFRSLAFTMSITLAALGAFGLIVIRADPSTRLLRAAILTSSLAVGAVVVLQAVYRIPPPFISLAVVELLFLAALVRAVKA